MENIVTVDSWPENRHNDEEPTEQYVEHDIEWVFFCRPVGYITVSNKCDPCSQEAEHSDDGNLDFAFQIRDFQRSVGLYYLSVLEFHTIPKR